MLATPSAEEAVQNQQNVIEYIQELTGKIDELTQIVTDLQRRVETLEDTMHLKSSGAPGKSSPTASKAALDPTLKTPESKSNKRSRPSVPSGQLLGDAMTALQHKNYDVATQLLLDLTQYYPEHPDAPEAYYWLGELSLIKQLFPEAQQHYARAYKELPKTNTLKADAGLKIAECYFALKKTKEGCLFLKEIMKLKQDGASVSTATLNLMEEYWKTHKCAGN